MKYDVYLPEMIALLQRLVETESPSNVKEAVDRVGAILADTSRNLGATVTTYPQTERGDHILAKWGEGDRGILLLGHMDTVFPLGTLQSMPFHERDGKIYGPGVQDMKGGLVIGLMAIKALIEADSMPEDPLTFLFTSDEEVGSQTSRAMIEELAKTAKVVFVLEPGLSDGSLKTWRKGVGDFQLRITGRSAHAGGNHEDGRNALEEMAHQILAIQKLTDYEKGTTLNVGVAHGGTVPNVVADFAELEIDLRVSQASEYEQVLAALQDLGPVLDGTSLQLSGELNRPPMPFDMTMQATFEKVQQIANKAGFELKAGGSGGASDANFVSPLGVPVMDGLGAVGDGLHSHREFIDKKSFVERVELLVSLLREW